MRLFWPEYRFQRAWQITPEWLARHGLTVLLLDVDNTLTTHDSPDIGPQARAWIAQMQQAGVRLWFFQTINPRVEPFAEMIGLGCIANAKTPWRRRAPRLRVWERKKLAGGCGAIRSLRMQRTPGGRDVSAGRPNRAGNLPVFPVQARA